MPSTLGSRLLLRIRRHARMTTLFGDRAQAAAGASQPAWMRVLPAGGPIVMAFLVPGGAPQQAEDEVAAGGHLPLHAVEDAGRPADAANLEWGTPSQQGVMGAAVPGMPRASKPAQPQATPRPTPAASGREATALTASVQRAAAAPSVASAPSEIARQAALAEARPVVGQTSVTDAATWRRLETIYEHHREKQAVEQRLVQQSVGMIAADAYLGDTLNTQTAGLDSAHKSVTVTPEADSDSVRPAPDSPMAAAHQPVKSDAPSTAPVWSVQRQPAPATEQLVSTQPPADSTAAAAQLAAQESSAQPSDALAQDAEHTSERYEAKSTDRGEVRLSTAGTAPTTIFRQPIEPDAGRTTSQLPSAGNRPGQCTGDGRESRATRACHAGCWANPQRRRRSGGIFAGCRLSVRDQPAA